MSTIEEDAERVRQVTEVLAGPQMVWVLRYWDKHGNGVVLFASQQGAINQLLEWFDKRKERFHMTEDEYHEIRKQIATGQKSYLNNEDDTEYAYDSQRVNP